MASISILYAFPPFLNAQDRKTSAPLHANKEKT